MCRNRCPILVVTLAALLLWVAGPASAQNGPAAKPKPSSTNSSTGYSGFWQGGGCGSPQRGETNCWDGVQQVNCYQYQAYMGGPIIWKCFIRWWGTALTADSQHFLYKAQFFIDGNIQGPDATNVGRLDTTTWSYGPQVTSKSWGQQQLLAGYTIAVIIWPEAGYFNNVVNSATGAFPG